MQDMLNIFDILYSIDGLYNVKKEEKSIKKIYRDGQTFSFDYLNYRFEIFFSKSFPISMPKITKLSGPFHCHIDSVGTVCLVNQEDVSYDINDGKALIIKTINALKKLLNMELDECEKEIEYEYNDYLQFFKNYSEEDCFIFESVKSGQLFIDDDIIFVGKDGFIVDDYCKDKKCSFRNYIQLDLDRLIPIEEKKIGTYDIHKCLNEKSIKRLEKYKNTSFEQYYILKYLNPDKLENYILIKIMNDGLNKYNNAFLNPNAKVTIYKAKNCTLDFLKRRGGCILTDKKVLVVGAGSVGSEIINQLVSSGFDDITIVDKDKFYLENGFRNTLGFSSLKILNKTFGKAECLKYFLKNQYPNLKCTTFDSDIVTLICQSKIDLNKFDYIIVAIGNSIVSSFINRFIYENNLRTKIIYTWIEPYGVAEHIMCLDTSKKGCYDCYLNSPSSINLASGDENYKIRNNVCSGSFTPYGKSSCCRIASNVVDKIIEDNENIIPFNNNHFVYKGNINYFLNKGFKMTKYMSMSQEELNRLSRDYIYEGCCTCGKCID